MFNICVTCYGRIDVDIFEYDPFIMEHKAEIPYYYDKKSVSCIPQDVEVAIIFDTINGWFVDWYRTYQEALEWTFSHELNIDKSAEEYDGGVRVFEEKGRLWSDENGDYKKLFEDDSDKPKSITELTNWIKQGKVIELHRGNRDAYRFVVLPRNVAEEKLEACYKSWDYPEETIDDHVDDFWQFDQFAM